MSDPQMTFELAKIETTGLMRGFIKITTYGSEQYVAVDQIRDFTPYDRYHPNGPTWLVLKDGTRLRPEESAQDIAEAIIKAGE